MEDGAYTLVLYMMCFEIQKTRQQETIEDQKLEMSCFHPK
jgi:hypothetical protein